jgi:hypothetical protein
MSASPKEPTPEECSANATVQGPYERASFACWYPQMGGYVGKCVIAPEGNGCFDAYIWHDGEFPFEGEGDGRSPVVLHHCDPEQFIRFGELVKKLYPWHEEQAE